MKKFLIAILIVVLMAGSAVGGVFIYRATQGSNNEITIVESEKGSISVSNDKAKAGEEVDLTCEPKNGYELDYYLVNGEKLDGSSFLMPEEDVEVSAEFKVIKYTITYENLSQYAVNSNTVTQYDVETNDITLREPTRVGYAFAGWYKESSFVHKLTKISKGSYGNLNLYAKWEALFEYNSSGEITALTNYAKNNSFETFTFPNKIDGQTITKIGSNLNINGTKYKNIVIEKGITTIGENVFKRETSTKHVEKVMYTGTLDEWCTIDFAAETSTPTIFCYDGTDFYINGMHLTGKITLPQTNYIKPYIFYNVGDITEIVLPSTVKYIGVSAFENCVGLLKANLSKVVMFYDRAFRNCKKLYSVGDFELAQSIGNRAFYNTDLTSVSFGDYLTTIGDSAFRDSSLNSVNLDSYRLTTVGDSAFYACSITELIVDTLYDVSFGEDAFANNIWLENIYLKSSTGEVSIGETTFEYCNIENIYINDSMIDEYKANAKWQSYTTYMKNLSDA